MDTEADRMNFRRYFILVVLKMFLCPTSQQTISPWHIPPILDVSDRSKFNWAHKTFKWLGKAIETHQNKKLETCGGYMFALMLLYFQRLRHDSLERCREPKPWLTAWTASELEKKATNAID
ncbi:uncharacterized protein LOC110270507 [Arachis ipaensis]|uniref:uncharacterized protein LOC110270507 n=1 Tax=Arachis ipaensis TaxID=130454 RepID=UPI000A2B0521|nr:uncharacterized protein LOC110270507 [Arachis ipaensis]